MRKQPRAIIGWTLAAVWLLTLPAAAVEYRFQVTNLDDRTFTSYLETDSPARRGEEAMRRLETRLDTMAFPAGAVLPGRQVQLLEDPGYGGNPLARLAVLPATGNQAWTTLVWAGNPGDTVALVVKSDMRAWQEVVEVAANPEGGLRRLPIGGPGFFGRQGRQVPDVSSDCNRSGGHWGKVDGDRYRQAMRQSAGAVPVRQVLEARKGQPPRAAPPRTPLSDSRGHADAAA